MPTSADTRSRRLPAEAAVCGSLARAIWRLAWPITLSQALFMLPNLYDSFWLGRLGSTAQAAAGLAVSVRVTMISVLMALSGASGAVVARFVGADDEDGANLATLQAIILMTASSGALGVLGYVLAEPLMRLAGADAAVLPAAVSYARVIFAGLIALELLPSVGGMLNTAGAPHIRLTMTLWMMGTQLVAEPLLAQRFGVAGAAAAVVTANAVGVLWGLGVLLSGRAAIRIDLHNLRLDFPIMGRIIRVALPSVVQRGAPNLANSLLIRLISSYGSPVLAAWIVTTRVLGVVQVPGMGLASAAGAMIGLNLGARQIPRAEKAVRWIVRIALTITAVLVLFLLVAAPWVLSWFGLETEALAPGAAMLRWVALGYLIQTVTLVYDAAQVGAGDTLSPMLVNLASLWLVQLPLAWLLSSIVGLGPHGIWWGLIAGWGTQAFLMVWRYRAARWQSIEV
ncbi:MAG: MATE family efflux transporter [Anaerolineae bacterium]|nr:MATE family efflux transporter [Anaerolineae bacterium]